MLYEVGWKCFATEGVTLSGVPKGTGQSMDSTLENSIKLDAEGAMLYANLSGKRTKFTTYFPVYSG